MTTRYRRTGAWHPIPDRRFHDDVKVEGADLLDTRTGTVYQEGIIRVSAPSMRPKSFKGETAWDHAVSLAYEITAYLNYQGE